MNNLTVDKKEPKGYLLRASKTVNGIKIYAKDYGKKCFVIPIY